MDSRNNRARELQAAIDVILLKDWDPIGVKDEPRARNEYSRYVGPVYHALAAGASEHELAALLEEIEHEMMGITRPPNQLAAVARRLRALEVHLG